MVDDPAAEGYRWSIHPLGGSADVPDRIPRVALGWWVGQTVELAVGGHVIGSLLGGARLRTVAWRVGLVLAVGAVSAVVLQTIGYATAPVISR